MLSRARASLAAALVLLAVCSTSAAAQQRACTAADSARVGWSAPPGVPEDAWRASLLSDRLVAPGAELVRIPYDSLHSLGGDVSLVGQLHRALIDEIEARLGDGPVKVVVLARIEPDSTVSRLLLAVPTGRVGIEESVGDVVGRLRFAPAVKDGCPMAIWYPTIIESSGTVRIGAGGASDFSGRGRAGPSAPASPRRPRAGAAPPVVVRSPGEHWVKVVQWDEGGADWIDTTSVSRVGEDVFRFTVRHTAAQVWWSMPDRISYDQTDDRMEFDCARGLSRSLSKTWMLAGRVVLEKEFPGQNLHRAVPRYHESYCPVLRQAQSRPPAAASPNQ